MVPLTHGSGDAAARTQPLPGAHATLAYATMSMAPLSRRVTLLTLGSTAPRRVSFVPAADYPPGASRPIYSDMEDYPRFVGHGRGSTYEPLPGQTLATPIGSIPQVRTMTLTQTQTLTLTLTQTLTLTLTVTLTVTLT